ncbi:hypothetical protein DV515_00013316 [Chloebia gouldiae]|uniref:Uncharacterized protein n=1 Tax=Chloebia gouldiae TaxID=44316 RepID=A0A3L8S121_CHLGU|nr:hypothetical protein DV515_00013316 [Chloebia gouldiae]
MQEEGHEDFSSNLGKRIFCLLAVQLCYIILLSLLYLQDSNKSYKNSSCFRWLWETAQELCCCGFLWIHDETCKHEIQMVVLSHEAKTLPLWHQKNENELCAGHTEFLRFLQHQLEQRISECIWFWQERQKITMKKMSFSSFRAKGELIIALICFDGSRAEAAMNRLTVFHGNNLRYFFIFLEFHFCVLAKAQACLSGQHDTEQMVEKKITEKSLQALSSHTFTPPCKRGQKKEEVDSVFQFQGASNWCLTTASTPECHRPPAAPEPGWDTCTSQRATLLGVGALQSTEVLQQSKSQWAVCFLKSCPVLSDKVEHETCTAKCISPLLRRASMGSSLRSGDFEERLVLSKAN